MAAAVAEQPPLVPPLERTSAPGPDVQRTSQPALEQQGVQEEQHQQQQQQDEAQQGQQQQQDALDAPSSAAVQLPDEDPASAFECNICLELARDPVVTLCGHLYCWPCLFRWMQLQAVCRQCPVCKAGVDTDKVVPIYGRASEQPDPRAGSEGKLEPLPARPAGQRTPVTPQPTAAPAQPTSQGVLPALFGFQLGPGQGYVEALTPEQQHQAFLSRLLLMLGSFVIMCLLLF
uniref:RING-type E3 ubiquitin transferase n=1 Tax=Dunaliella tertiolecta TaxID=3047 RepID=A0A7S3QTB6_DUNTE